jgi:Cu+-exporting ATPase
MALSSLSVVGNANRLRGWRSGPLPNAARANITPQVQVGARDDVRSHAQEESTMQHDREHASTNVFIDPICGMTVAPDTAAASREVDGTTYYFCSTQCAATFDADPDRYTSAAAE